MAQRPPIVILGGSDRKPAELPEQGRDEHPLSGYKGADLLFDGRPLVMTIVRRLQESGRFGPVFIAGPDSAYGRIESGAELVDTDGTFEENIFRSLQRVRERHASGPVAFITCDVLPEVETLRAVMEAHAAEGPCDVYFPMIRAPEQPDRLGASGWKPRYKVIEKPGQPPTRVLPCHLIVVDPDALRLPLLYQLFRLGYRTRNRSIAYRRAVMLRSLLLGLIWQDVLHVCGLRWPTLTWTVAWNGSRMAIDLARGRLTRRRMERGLRMLLVKHRHRERHSDRHVRLPVIDGLSLALDFDTEEEARAIGARVASR